MGRERENVPTASERRSDHSLKLKDSSILTFLKTTIYLHDRLYPGRRPSQCDIAITSRPKEALELIDVKNQVYGGFK